MATLEFPGLRSIEFSPENRDSWSQVQNVCLGTQTQNLTEALLLTSLPSKLKTKYPHLKVYAYYKGFNSVVFKANPYINGLRYMPREIFGDGITGGNGHLIQVKEQFFSLKESTEPKPELFLTEKEKTACQDLIQEKLFPFNIGKPLCILHAWNSRQKVAPVEFWDTFVARWKNQFRFWQVGLENDSAIQGCEYYFLTRPTLSNVRKLFALVNYSDLFIGIDSSPMHLARAFDKPSLILLNHLAQGPENRRHYIHPLFQYMRIDEDPSKIDGFLNRHKAKDR